MNIALYTPRGGQNLQKHVKKLRAPPSTQKNAVSKTVITPDSFHSAVELQAFCSLFHL